MSETVFVSSNRRMANLRDAGSSNHLASDSGSIHIDNLQMETTFEDMILCNRAQTRQKSQMRDQLKEMTPWWFVSFHYRDNHADEQELILDAQDLKKKLRRAPFLTK